MIRLESPRNMNTRRAARMKLSAHQPCTLEAVDPRLENSSASFHPLGWIAGVGFSFLAAFQCTCARCYAGGSWKRREYRERLCGGPEQSEKDAGPFHSKRHFSSEIPKGLLTDTTTGLCRQKSQAVVLSGRERVGTTLHPRESPGQRVKPSTRGDLFDGMPFPPTRKGAPMLLLHPLNTRTLAFYLCSALHDYFCETSMLERTVAREHVSIFPKYENGCHPRKINARQAVARTFAVRPRRERC